MRTIGMVAFVLVIFGWLWSGQTAAHAKSIPSKIAHIATAKPVTNSTPRANTSEQIVTVTQPASPKDQLMPASEANPETTTTELTSEQPAPPPSEPTAGTNQIPTGVKPTTPPPSCSPDLDNCQPNPDDKNCKITKTRPGIIDTDPYMLNSYPITDKCAYLY